MKSIPLNVNVLGGQGSLGSVPTVSNPAPIAAGTTADPSLSTEVVVGPVPASPASGDAVKSGVLLPRP